MWNTTLEKNSFFAADYVKIIELHTLYTHDVLFYVAQF